MKMSFVCFSKGVRLTVPSISCHSGEFLCRYDMLMFTQAASSEDVPMNTEFSHQHRFESS